MAQSRYLATNDGDCFNNFSDFLIQSELSTCSTLWRVSSTKPTESEGNNLILLLLAIQARYRNLNKRLPVLVLSPVFNFTKCGKLARKRNKAAGAEHLDS